MSVRTLCLVVVLAGTLARSDAAFAAHVPVALDVPAFWTPTPGSGAGYLNFMTPGTVVFPLIATEEHTGWTDIGGAGVVDPLGPPIFPAGPDNDPHAGDRADFDWVQENRPHELGLPPISNHPGVGGFMGWNIRPTLASPHTTVGPGPHAHLGTPTLPLPDFAGPFFNAVDVFSNTSTLDADIGGAREGALDYFVEFSNTITGLIAPGIPVLVFAPGWTAATGSDDFVARWVAASPGAYNQVAIDPEGGFGHDEVTEIDAVVVVQAVVPEPSTLLLFATTVICLYGYRRRSKSIA